MLVKDLFVYPIGRPITQVIKLDDLSATEVIQEISEYVVTPQIEQHLLDILEAFVATRKGQQSQTDHIGIWLSGFFGSGKSHLAKMLGYLLRNEPVRVDGATQHAIDIFMDRVDDESSRKRELRGLLTQVRNFFRNQVLMFQIKSQEDQLNRAGESISLILYRQYLAALGLSSDPWIGRLELALLRRGRFDAFREAIEREEKQPWEELRKDFAVVRPAIVRAMCAAMPETYRSEEQAGKAFEDIRSGLSLSPALLARELSEYAATQDAGSGEQSFKVVFIIDEMGQFIGDDGQRLLELQSIAEEFATQGGGRLWLVVTAQEALEDVIAGVKQRRQDYARIIDRFSIQLRMTSENIEKVLEERLLKKRAAAHADLNDLFMRHQGQITMLAMPDSNRRIATPSIEQFERTYPFLPYHFRLMQDAFASLRARGGRAVQLTGAERSMLGVVQGVLNSPRASFANAMVGRLVTLDEIYDQVAREVTGDDRRTIDSAADSVEPRGSVAPEKALKAVFLLSQVEWLTRNLENVARTLTAGAEADFNRHRDAVAKALEDLKQARYLVEVDGQFRYLSAAERGIEDEIASEQIKHNDIRRAARELLKNTLTGIGRVNYENGTASFDVRILADDEEIRAAGEITLKIYSPIAVAYDTELTPANFRDVQSPGDERSVFWLPGEITSPKPDLERLLRLESVLHRRIGGDAGPEERSILREKETEAASLRTRLAQAFSRALFTGTLIYNGEAIPLDGRTNSLNVIFNRELGKVIPHVYTRFGPAAVKVTEKSIADMLTAKSAMLPGLDPGLRLWDPQSHINTSAPVVQPILDELRRRGGDADGKSLSEYFRSAPFGWETVVVRVVLAALFRAGVIGVQVSQRYFTDPSDSAAQEALTKSAAFNKATFDYDPTGGLTLDQRREACRQLDVLFERQVDDTTNTLARTLGEELGRLKSQNELLLARMQGASLTATRTSDIVSGGDAGLPVPDAIFRGKALLDSVLMKQKLDDQVKAFLEHVDAITELQAQQRRIEEFFALGHDKTYSMFRNVAAAIQHALGDVKALDVEEVRQALEDLQALQAERAVVQRWSDVQQAGRVLVTTYQHVYADLFARRTRAYSDARDQVAMFGEAPDEITNRIAEAPERWNANGTSYEGQQATLLDLYNDLQLVDQRKANAIADLQREREREVAADNSTQKGLRESPIVAPVFVRISDYLEGEIDDEATLEAKLDTFSARIRSELAQGRKVIIG